MMLTIRDLKEMAYMGYTVKAMYKTSRGIPFHKFFTGKAEFERFSKDAERVGTRLESWAERRAN